MTTWLTSDQHFRHGRLLELSPARGEAFPTVSDMNARLLHNWKAVVQPDDTVWVLGVVDMQRQGRRPRPSFTTGKPSCNRTTLCGCSASSTCNGKDAALALVEQLVDTKILSAATTTPAGAGMRDGWKNRTSPPGSRR